MPAIPWGKMRTWSNPSPTTWQFSHRSIASHGPGFQSPQLWVDLMFSIKSMCTSHAIIACKCNHCMYSTERSSPYKINDSFWFPLFAERFLDRSYNIGPSVNRTLVFSPLPILTMNLVLWNQLKTGVRGNKVRERCYVIPRLEFLECRVHRRARWSWALLTTWPTLVPQQVTFVARCNNIQHLGPHGWFSWLKVGVLVRKGEEFGPI